MAFKQTQSGVIQALHNPMFLDAQNGILTARGVETATRRKKGGNDIPIRQYRNDKNISKHLP
jgi:hypothetical protein